MNEPRVELKWSTIAKRSGRYVVTPWKHSHGDKFALFDMYRSGKFSEYGGLVGIYTSERGAERAAGEMAKRRGNK